MPGRDTLLEGAVVDHFAARSVSERDRGRGAALGLAVGDALGTTLEFTAPQSPPLPNRLTGPHTAICGGGPFRLAAGQVTDDTQMACALTASLVAQGRFQPDDVGSRYVQWSHIAFDIGRQTLAALGRVKEGVPATDAGREVWIASGRRAAGNGSLMRTLPIALLYASADRRRVACSLADSAITHFDPRCQLACASYNGAVAAAIAQKAGPRQMAAAAMRDLNLATEMLHRTHPQEQESIRRANADLRADLAAADSDAPRLYTDKLHLVRHAGFVRVAYRLAFWHLLHTDSFEQALIDVVNRGADADTNGAIVGGLLGAVHGMDAIPHRWRQTVLTAVPCAENEPLSTTYHPRSLLNDIQKWGYA